MKDLKQYIDSGVLELFVSGNLSEEEASLVAQEIAQSSELTQEVEKIEAALMHIARATAPQELPIYRKADYIKDSREKDVIPLSRKTSISTYIGWAAAALLLVGLSYFYTQNQTQEDALVELKRELLLEKGKTQVAQENLVYTKNILNVLRKNDIIKVPLGPQEISPNAYAQVFWDKENSKTYIDVRGLPEPPEGKVYQVWSLTLEPLTPTSLGVLKDYDLSSFQIFELDNSNASEAFGITLEPSGGSSSPTLEQLYALGVVES